MGSDQLDYEPFGRRNLPLARTLHRSAEVLAIIGLVLGVGWIVFEAASDASFSVADRAIVLGPAIAALVLSMVCLVARDSKLTRL